MHHEHEMQLLPDSEGRYDSRDAVRFLTASLNGSLEMQENLAQWVLSQEDDSCNGIYDAGDGQLTALLLSGRALLRVVRGLWRVAQTYTPHKIVYFDVNPDALLRDLEVWLVIKFKNLS